MFVLVHIMTSVIYATMQLYM